MSNEGDESKWESLPDDTGIVRIGRKDAGSIDPIANPTTTPDKSPWLSHDFWKSMGPTFLIGGAVVFGSIIFLGSISPTPMSEKIRIADNVGGNWVLAAVGGEDGQTRCSDFNASALYKLNNNTAKLISMTRDGQYRSLFAYTTPSGNEHTQSETARWKTFSETLMRSDIRINNGPVSGEGDSDSFTMAMTGKNILTLSDKGGSFRYARCIGEPNDVLGMPPEEVTPKPKPKPSAASAHEPTYTYTAPPEQHVERRLNPMDICQNQDLINLLPGLYREAIGNMEMSRFSSMAEAANWVYSEGIHISRRLREFNYRFTGIRPTGYEQDDSGVITIRCQADMKLYEPMPGSNGMFNQYIQFNDVRYTYRYRNDAPEENALVVEIPTKNGEYDIETGTE